MIVKLKLATIHIPGLTDRSSIVGLLQFTAESITPLTNNTHRDFESQQMQRKKELKELSNGLSSIQSNLNKNNPDDAHLYRYIDLLLQMLSILYDRINHFSNEKSVKVLTNINNISDKNNFNNTMITISKIINESIKLGITHEQNKYNNKTVNKRLLQHIIYLIESLTADFQQSVTVNKTTEKCTKLITSCITKVEHTQRITTKMV